MELSLKYRVEAPTGVKIITNSCDNLTFARKNEVGDYELFTCSTGDFEFDLTNVKWITFSKDELQQILKIK